MFVAMFRFQGYDISFLITNFHTEQMYKHKLVDFVVQVSAIVTVASYSTQEPSYMNMGNNRHRDVCVLHHQNSTCTL